MRYAHITTSSNQFHLQGRGHPARTPQSPVYSPCNAGTGRPLNQAVGFLPGLSPAPGPSPQPPLPSHGPRFQAQAPAPAKQPCARLRRAPTGGWAGRELHCGLLRTGGVTPGLSAPGAPARRATMPWWPSGGLLRDRDPTLALAIARAAASGCRA